MLGELKNILTERIFHRPSTAGRASGIFKRRNMAQMKSTGFASASANLAKAKATGAAKIKMTGAKAPKVKIAGGAPKVAKTPAPVRAGSPIQTFAGRGRK